jgi:hypothetical protein
MLILDTEVGEEGEEEEVGWVLTLGRKAPVEEGEDMVREGRRSCFVERGKATVAEEAVLGCTTGKAETEGIEEMCGVWSVWTLI